MNQHAFASVKEQSAFEERYRITPAVHQALLDIFKDRNPIHENAEFAQGQGFRERVMHGAILQGFLSHFVGMVFPGKNSLLLRTDLRFLKPSYLHDEIVLRAEVKQKVESQRAVLLRVEFENTTQKLVVARGEVLVGFLPEVQHGK